MLGHVGVGAHEQQPPAGDVRHARPDLLTVDDPLVAVAHGRRGERRDVGPGTGLAEHLAPDLFARERRAAAAAPAALRCRTRSASARPSRRPSCCAAGSAARAPRSGARRRDPGSRGRDRGRPCPRGSGSTRARGRTARPRTPRSRRTEVLGEQAFDARPRRRRLRPGGRLGCARRRHRRGTLTCAYIASATIAWAPRQGERMDAGPRVHERARPGGDDPARRRVARESSSTATSSASSASTRDSTRTSPSPTDQARARSERCREATRGAATSTAPPFLGVPISIKDLADTAGIRTHPRHRDLRRPRSRRRRRGRRPHPARRLRDPRQDEHARVRIALDDREPALSRPRATRGTPTARRAARRAARARRMAAGLCADRARLRRRRLDPHPRRVVRARRAEAVAWARVVGARSAERQRDERPARPHRRRRGRVPRRDAGLRHRRLLVGAAARAPVPRRGRAGRPAGSGSRSPPATRCPTWSVADAWRDAVVATAPPTRGARATTSTRPIRPTSTSRARRSCPAAGRVRPIRTSPRRHPRLPEPHAGADRGHRDGQGPRGRGGRAAAGDAPVRRVLRRLRPAAHAHARVRPAAASASRSWGPRTGRG